MGQYVYKAALLSNKQNEYTSFLVENPYHIATYKVGITTVPQENSGPLFCFPTLTQTLEYIRSFRMCLNKEPYLLKGYTEQTYDAVCVGYHTDFSYENHGVWIFDGKNRIVIESKYCTVKGIVWANDFRTEKAYHINMK